MLDNDALLSLPPDAIEAIHLPRGPPPRWHGLHADDSASSVCTSSCSSWFDFMSCTLPIESKAKANLQRSMMMWSVASGIPP